MTKVIKTPTKIMFTLRPKRITEKCSLSYFRKYSQLLLKCFNPICKFKPLIPKLSLTERSVSIARIG